MLPDSATSLANGRIAAFDAARPRAVEFRRVHQEVLGEAAKRGWSLDTLRLVLIKDGLVEFIKARAQCVFEALTEAVTVTGIEPYEGMSADLKQFLRKQIEPFVGAAEEFLAEWRERGKISAPLAGDLDIRENARVLRIDLESKIDFFCHEQSARLQRKRSGEYDVGMPQALSGQIRTFASVEEIDRGIAKIKRRRDEVAALQGAKHTDPQAQVVQSNVRKTILEIFGQQSSEHAEYRTFRVWYPSSTDEADFEQDFQKGVQKSLTLLDGLMRRLGEDRADFTPSLAPVVSATGDAIFIGHGQSLQWLVLQGFLKDTLHLHCVEYETISPAGVSTPERLQELLDDSRFAFLVLTAEDEQADGTKRARENVVHEAGLFQGRLGFRRAIVLLEDGCNEFSNIKGLGQIRFPKGQIDAASEKVRRVLQREKIIKPD